MNKYEPPKMEVLNTEIVAICERVVDGISTFILRVWEEIKDGWDDFICKIHVQNRAFLWAKYTHPEWLKILNRTKKRRIKEKYRKRILREYLKQKEAET